MKETTSAHNKLAEKSRVVERPFTSNVPLAGPFIARFREAWNSVSTKWYVRPLLAQQNSYNRLVAEQLQDLDSRLIVQDQEQTSLIHDSAELTTQLIQINRQLDAIEQRLKGLETGERSK
jgi:septal ring factor EnvC (AmiA/AmiB activator)